MKQAVAIRHVSFEDMGSFAGVLDRAGYSLRYVEAGWDDLISLEPLVPDLLVVLGGPIGAYEEELYPFIETELEIIRQRLAAQLPLLGICLGAQMMARALGARVYAGGNGKEIGWSPLQLTAAGLTSPLRYLVENNASVLHWHGDTFDLPAGAELLASTKQYPHQAFAVGKHALGLQFHPEVTARGLERWFIGHAAEIGNTVGISVPQLRSETARCASALEKQGQQFFADWLQRL